MVILLVNLAKSLGGFAVRRSSILVGVLVFWCSSPWFVFNPGTDVGTDEEMAESQETGNWNEPVVQVVERMGPVTVKIETVRDVLVDQFFFYQVQQQKGVGSGVIYRRWVHLD